MCDPSLAFAEQVEATLGTVFDLFSAPGNLLCLLPMRRDAESVAVRQIVWQKIFAARLHAAADRVVVPAEHPAFLEQFLVAAVQTQIRRWLHGDRARPLQALLPETLEFVFAYYPEARPASPRHGER